MLTTAVAPASLPDAAASQQALALLALADADATALGDAMHDDVLQALVVARYATESVARGADPELAREAVQHALVTLRRTVWLLRPRGSDGLGAALSELAAQHAAAGRVPPTLTLDAEAADLVGPLAGTVYRFVQSVDDGTGARVVVRRDAESLVVHVDGCPADVAGWRARAAAHGGRLTTGPDGTTLLAPWPPTGPRHATTPTVPHQGRPCDPAPRPAPALPEPKDAP